MRRALSGVLDRVGDWLARLFSGRGERLDVDRRIYLESAARIGVRVAAVSAGLVVSIIALLILYLAWQATPAQIHEEHGPTDIHIYLDTVDIAIAVIVIAVFTVVLACAASWTIARRAVRPLAEALRMQRRFVADASHELRTPLAVLGARLERLEALVDEGDLRSGVVADLRADARIMTDIVNDMLRSAAGDGDPGGEAWLRAEASAALRDMGVIAQQDGVRLVHGEIPDVRLPVQAVQLRRAIVSLLDNAIDHTPEGGTVTFGAAAGPSRVRLTFADTGAGISGIDPERVFDRFAHGTSTSRRGRRATRTGYGIGLSLVKEFAVRCGGTVDVEHTGPDGATFVLELPRS